MRSLASTTFNTTAVTANCAKVPLWKSPVPYLFGGLALTLLLIATALIILSCSKRKGSGGSSADEEKKPASPAADRVLDMEPKIFVVMAGDDKPTFLATPSSFPLASSTKEEQESKV